MCMVLQAGEVRISLSEVTKKLFQDCLRFCNRVGYGLVQVHAL